MQKSELVKRFMDGDDAEIAQMIGIKRQQVRYWRVNENAKTKYEGAIIGAAREIGIDKRPLEMRLVPVKG